MISCAHTAKKMEELAKKRENTTRKRSRSTGAAGVKKRKTTADSEVAGPSSNSSSSAGSSSSSTARLSSRSAAAIYRPGEKEGESESEINSDECCVCYRTFQDNQREGTGLEWVQCVYAKGGSMKNVPVK